MKWLLVVATLSVLPCSLLGQERGAVAGAVTEQRNGTPVAGARVEVDDGSRAATTDTEGRFFVRAVQPGLHRITVRAVGFRPVTTDSILVEGGRTVRLEVVLVREAVPLRGVVIEAAPDPLLDPQVTQSVQRVGADALRELPVSSLSEAVALQAGVVQGSFRGGRLGQETIVIDGYGVKNQLDASSGPLGLRIPPAAIQDASVITNAFSARYGQALSAVITANTKEGGDHVSGRAAFETDRPMPNGWDVGLDRFAFSIGGPLAGPVRFFAAIDAQARLDDDPVHAPPSDDPLDPRSERLRPLPHAAGERYDLFGKVTIPLGSRQTVRVMGIASHAQREVFDPVLKYASALGTGESIGGRLLTLHAEQVSNPGSTRPLLVDLRLGYFAKEQMRAPLLAIGERRFGAFTLHGWEFAGSDIANRRDTVRGAEAFPGMSVPEFERATPWGVPAFFYTSSPRGEVRWNHFREVRARVDVLYGSGRATDLRFGATYIRQWIDTFSRLEAYRAVRGGAPPPITASFAPFQASGYVEWQQRASDVTFTAGVRADAFRARGLDGTGAPKTRLALGPRIAVSTAVGFGTVVASYGRFVQPPDFQYLVDASFDDTLRTGRFRRGNPTLGFEASTQYEIQFRVRATPTLGLRAGVYFKQLDGLVASVPVGFDPDSALFRGADFGHVKGLEVTLERDYRSDVGVRATYVFQQAEATATDARDLVRRFRIVPTGDTIVPAETEFPLDFDRRHSVVVVARGRIPVGAPKLLRGTEGGVVMQLHSGLPFTRTTLDGDSLIGLPNSHRLPAQFTLDFLVRRSFDLGATRLSLSLDVRNVTNRRNVLAVRRSSGQPEATDSEIAAMVQEAYASGPHPIPYESPRYRAWADQDGDGLIAGATELLPLYERAARDFAQPLFAFGIPRLVRLGVEVAF